ncbi:MAG: RluA family pseudouridine synthase [Endomicrobium sp.]|jgi:23S rRNA pseudouridine1911/1915/1917 synthase|nr:RluA family pseudouridine synthase [Endomicrobium sp.]
MQTEIVYNKKISKIRLDFYLASIYKKYSRSYFQKHIKKKEILINGKSVLKSYNLKYKDIITITFNFFQKTQKYDIKPEKIKLNIIYEDDDVIILDKQAGIVTHPSYSHTSETLLNALVMYFNGKYCPYLVHRLDKNTSGIIIFAKNIKAKINISKQLKDRTIKKVYLTAVKGIIQEDKGEIKAPIGRSPKNRKIMSVNSLAKKMAITEFEVLARKNGYTLLRVMIITGRTHQIRSHMKYIKHPIIGDQQYGGPVIIDNNYYKRQVLHAYKITFLHPRTSNIMNFISEPHDDIKKIFNI